MIGDIDIDESITDRFEEQGILEEKMQEAMQRIAIEREKLLALALRDGYDGVDIHMDTSIVTDYRDYSMGFEYEAWEGEAPTINRWEANVQRYDFRVLDKREKQQLLARIGVSERKKE